MLLRHPALRAFDFDAAIVDLDGTMVDTLGDFSAALNGMLADLQLPAITAQAIENMVGKGSEHLIRSVLTHVGVKDRPHAPPLRGSLPPEGGLTALAGCRPGRPGGGDIEALYPQAWDRYQHHYLAINGQYAQVYDGVREGLQALRAQGLRLACLTNKPLAFAQPLLRAKGLDGLFEQVFGGDSFARKKPDPLPLLKTCEALGTAPARTLMIGDSSNDARAARAAGCPVALVSYGYNHGEPVQAVDADACIASLQELTAAPASLSV